MHEGKGIPEVAVAKPPGPPVVVKGVESKRQRPERKPEKATEPTSEPTPKPERTPEYNASQDPPRPQSRRGRRVRVMADDLVQVAIKADSDCDVVEEITAVQGMSYECQTPADADLVVTVTALTAEPATNIWGWTTVDGVEVGSVQDPTFAKITY